ncbi:hypothetical protein GJAV_G00021470 [Gymnothorax javanicus]|nr:hypothetical protein GJAV_G00021470 [Gymnothorax javanicus]
MISLGEHRDVPFATWIVAWWNSSVCVFSLTIYLQLQKSQRETSKLHQELDELLLKMAPLEKQSQECEAMRAELEEKNNSLKKFQLTCEELDRLKEEKTELLTSKKSLESQLKTCEDASVTKDGEITELKKEKNKLEENLHSTQNSLEKAQLTCDELDRLKEENAKLLASKRNLENQLKISEVASVMKDSEITQLKKEKKKLEENLHTTQKNLEELKILMHKDLKDVAAQTTFPEEPKIDKAEVKRLLEKLWMCIEPQSSQAADQLHLLGVTGESLDYGSDPVRPVGVSARGAEGPSVATSPRKSPKKRRESGKLWKEKRSPPSAALTGTEEKDVEEILDCFRPLPPLLSPVLFTSPEATLFGDISSDEEDVDDECQEVSTMETSDTSLALADDVILDSSAPCSSSAVETSRDEDVNTFQSDTQTSKLEKNLAHSDDVIMEASEEAPVDEYFGTHTVSDIVSTELSIPECADGVRNEDKDVEDAVKEEPPPKDNEECAEVDCEKALPQSPSKYKCNNQVSQATLHGDSVREPSPLRESSDDSGRNKGVDAHLETPTSSGHLIQASPSDGVTQSQESSEGEHQNLLSTLNGMTADDDESEQTVSKSGSAVNLADGPESICFSEGRPQNDADLAESAPFSKSPLRQSDKANLPKEPGQDASHSEICAGPYLNLTPYPEPETMSELHCGALNSSEPNKNPILASFEVSNHTTEKVFTTNECQKPSEMNMEVYKEQDLVQTCQVPALNLPTNSSESSHLSTDKCMDQTPACSEANPLVEADSTPAEIPADQDKMEGSSSGDPEKCKESSDEQEGFGLLRKVKSIYQRAGNQALPESDRDSPKPVQDSAEICEDSLKSSGASYESLENLSKIEQKSTDSSLEIDLSTCGKQVEDDVEDIPMEEICTERMGENQTLHGIEKPSKGKNKECKGNLDQAPEVMDEAASEFFSWLTEKPCSLQANDKTDKSTAAEEPDSGKNCSHSSSTDIPFVNTQPGTFRSPLISSRKRKHSGNGQESLQNLKDERILMNLPVLATTNILTPEKLRKVRSEMGPPLPPLLNPLTITPPRFMKQELKNIPSKLPVPSNEGTPVRESSTAALGSPLSDGSNGNSPCLSISSAGDSKRRRVMSSPLQFSSTTPKHAVPVPGKLPISASNSSSSSPSAPQENSVRILDTMYPELSARARTLNILRGTVNRNTCVSNSGTAESDSAEQISSFKAVSSSRVLHKTGQPNEQEPGLNQSIGMSSASERVSPARAGPFGRKTGVNVLLPKSSIKREGSSPVTAMPHGFLANQKDISPAKSTGVREDGQDGKMGSAENPILSAMAKIEMACFDLMPVIKSRVSVIKNIKTPVLREEEKEVIQEFCEKNKHLADEFLSAIQTKMKTEKNALSGVFMQALCRVYAGICRQKEDWEKVHLFAYCLLKEDFPDSAKLVLFIVTTWYNVLAQTGVLCRAIHAVLRLKAREDVLLCLTEYLDWEKNPPADCEKIIKSTLMAMRMGVNMKFQKHDRHGEDLNHAAWTYIFTVDVLCTHKQWKWTHDNIICKELWPIMNSWVMQPRSRQIPIKDISVATTLRLIGRLGQLGIKEKSCTSVKNVAQVINTFVRHGKAEGVPWTVQLAAVYTIYDLSPCNPKEALDALAAWRGDTSETVPPAVTSCITQIGSVCRYIK